MVLPAVTISLHQSDHTSWLHNIWSWWYGVTVTLGDMRIVKTKTSDFLVMHLVIGYTIYGHGGIE